MQPNLPDIQLCNADEATFWPWLRWPEFANWPDKPNTVVVIPIAGLADYGLSHGLDAEEKVLMAVLRLAAVTRPPELRLLVVPPIRFTLGPKPTCAFPIDPDVACDLLEEVASWVGDAGFSKILFFNASPWNEELTKAVGRDLRIARKLQIFCVQLSALELDFNAARADHRVRLTAVLAALAGDLTTELAAFGQEILAATAARLVGMLTEMRDLPALANGGALFPKVWK